MKKDFLILIGLVFIGLFSRLVPHEWNFTAMGAVSLLSGYFISNKYLKFLTPVIALVVSDIFIGFHDTMLFVYLGFGLMTLISSLFIDAKSVQKWFLVPFGGSLVFFFVSNFGVWFSGNLYAKNFAGLMDCLMMGVPFYKAQFFADMILTPVLYLIFLFVLRPAAIHFLNMNFLALRKRN